ncbi:sugar transferase [Slackia heliotrinireducens]|uniref:sugar transferase n=1 Tax=Slackia heliotrinireducens TaxID=84110 RepID=UPI003315F7AF
MSSNTAAEAIDAQKCEEDNVIEVVRLTEEDFFHWDDPFETHVLNDGQKHASDLLDYPNYNDEPDPAVVETVSRLVDTNKVIELETINLDAVPKKYVYRFVKRAFDVVSCSVAIALCALPMTVIAIMVKRDSPGPVFYHQQRLGYMGRKIDVVKFRSMRVDAEAQGAQWAQGEDPRVTKIGSFLRNTRLDELPQFWSVVKGALSLIGPRPERAIFYREFEKYIHGFYQRMYVRPGIAWDIIAPKPEAGKKVSGARILSAYEGSRTVRAVAA